MVPLQALNEEAEYKRAWPGRISARTLVKWRSCIYFAHNGPFPA